MVVLINGIEQTDTRVLQLLKPTQGEFHFGERLAVRPLLGDADYLRLDGSWRLFKSALHIGDA